MGKIIKDGVEHFFFGGGSGSGDNIEIMTRAEYDALVEAGTVDADVVYFITDAGEGSTGGGNNVDLSELTEKVNNLEQSFQDGVDTVVSAVNTKAGSSLTRENTPNEIADVIENIETGRKVVSLGTGTSFNVSSYAGYNNFTVDNFYIQPSGTISTRNYGYASAGNNVGQLGVDSLTASIKLSYNASTGVLTANLTASAVGGVNGVGLTASGTANVKAYLVY